MRRSNLHRVLAGEGALLMASAATNGRSLAAFSQADRIRGLPTRRRIVCGSRQRYQLTKCEVLPADHRDETRSGHAALSD
jgi:hypothetical protein